ncbi:MAG: bifunctional aspartate kinase/homoserine dehydrogenase I [Myxococcales bacterium]|nr:bifunctional aspartate kinase/homoserine dehydrogenase I [Myxococcales bacterium]MCB9642758.1 bifunctional aspartate kinase/homoserine dehydrogenase I [Myxococcales bacterium]
MQVKARFRVLKFGGTSLHQPHLLCRVIQIISKARQEGPTAVVVSAMGDTTELLLHAADAAALGKLPEAEAIIDRIHDLALHNALACMRQLRTDQDPRGDLDDALKLTPQTRELLTPLRQILLGISLLRQKTAQSLDLVVSFGERLSARLLSLLLQVEGLDAVDVDARQWVITNDNFGSADVDNDTSRSRLLALHEQWKDKVSVHTGFIGQTHDGRVTTLGRNGSDYTATLLANYLKAERVERWTSLPGVMTADPVIVPDAYPVQHLSYLEALELAHYGSRVLHPRTMLPLLEADIPMRIRNVEAPEEHGTWIHHERKHQNNQPTCVTSLENLALIDIRWRKLSKQAHMSERVLHALRQADIPLWMATQPAHGQAVAVVLPKERLADATRVLKEELGADLLRKEAEPFEVVSPVTLLSLVGEGMSSDVDVTGRFFHTLGMVGVSVLAIAQGKSSRSISCVVDAKDTYIAVRTVHAAFNFAHQDVSLFLLGQGVVGSQLQQQLLTQHQKLREQHDVHLRLVGLANSRELAFQPEGLPAGSRLDEIAEDLRAPHDRPTLLSVLDQLRRLPVPILVDCTAASNMEDIYQEAFARGIHVVAANKKPLTIHWPKRQELLQAARHSHRTYRYETTVGASLPVIDTLQDLVRTGDHVLRIEGSFSGTLGYLTDKVMSGTRLSQAVRTARELGYSEPQPQDDLSGLDVARKALILIRELGIPMELEHIVVEPLVPSEILEKHDLDEFFAALEQHDETFQQYIDALKAEGQILRYLAILVPPDHPDDPIEARVGPVGVPAEHPATRLRGSESFVAFTTERYQEYPMIVQGAGAGGAVTAAGVLADIFRIAQHLRGR